MPADSSIRTISDLKGKTIGVISMGGGVLFAKAVIAMAGMDPERDVRIVVAGESAQTAAMVRSKQVDALCQFDTQYALVENAGVKLRLLEAKGIDRFPGNGFPRPRRNASDAQEGCGRPGARLCQGHDLRHREP